MTNIIAQLTVNLVLVTNWTGHNVGTNELGYIATNHVAQVLHEGDVTMFSLKSVPSSTAVWRPAAPQFIAVTNYNWWPYVTPTNVTLTNYGNLSISNTLELK